MQLVYSGGTRAQLANGNVVDHRLQRVLTEISVDGSVTCHGCRLLLRLMRLDLHRGRDASQFAVNTIFVDAFEQFTRLFVSVGRVRCRIHVHLITCIAFFVILPALKALKILQRAFLLILRR